MNHRWSIDQKTPELRVVRLEPFSSEEKPAALAEELSLAIGESFLDESSVITVEIDFIKWHEVDSRVFAFLLYFHRRCRDRGFKLTISSPPRQLVEMTLRLGVSVELGVGVSRSRDYRQLFLQENKAS